MPRGVPGSGPTSKYAGEEYTPPTRPRRPVVPDSDVELARDLDEFSAYIARLGERMHLRAEAIVPFLEGFAERLRVLHRCPRSVPVPTTLDEYTRTQRVLSGQETINGQG